jgi:hypothetical protein
MGLGPLHTVSLAEARSKALAARKQLLDGIDPLEVKNRERATLKAAAAKALSFDQCAEAYVEAHRAGWKNVKHGEQWANTLATYVSPHFGSLSVSSIDGAEGARTDPDNQDGNSLPRSRSNRIRAGLGHGARLSHG